MKNWADRPGDRLGDQLVLAVGEVAVDRRPSHARLAGGVVDRGLGDAVAAEARHRGLQDARTGHRSRRRPTHGARSGGGVARWWTGPGRAGPGGGRRHRLVVGIGPVQLGVALLALHLAGPAPQDERVPDHGIGVKMNHCTAYDRCGPSSSSGAGTTGSARRSPAPAPAAAGRRAGASSSTAGRGGRRRPGPGRRACPWRGRWARSSPGSPSADQAGHGDLAGGRGVLLGHRLELAAVGDPAAVDDAAPSRRRAPAGSAPTTPGRRRWLRARIRTCWSARYVPVAVARRNSSVRRHAS